MSSYKHCKGGIFILKATIILIKVDTKVEISSLMIYV